MPVARRPGLWLTRVLVFSLSALALMAARSETGWDAVRASQAEREAMLKMAEPLEALDLQEGALWEGPLATLPATLLDAGARDREQTLRRSVLPLLLVRQREYRALERELARQMAQPVVRTEGERALLLARVLAVRERSALTADTLQQLRQALTDEHVQLLAHAGRRGWRADARWLDMLQALRAQRVPLAAALETGRREDDASRGRATARRLSAQLAAADLALDAAARNEAMAWRLRGGAENSTWPLAWRRPLADALETSAQSLLHGAAVLGEFDDATAEPWLAATGEAAPTDADLGLAFTQWRGAAQALRRSLEQRLALLPPWQSLARQRDQVMDGARYLDTADPRHVRHSALRGLATRAWQEVTALQHRLVAADNSVDEGAVAQVLGERLEAVVLIETHLHEMAADWLRDPAPRPNDPRQGEAATRWQQDLDRLQTIAQQHADGLQAWQLALDTEALHFAALGALQGRVAVLYRRELERLADAARTRVTGDEVVGRLVRDGLDQALRAARRGEAAMQTLTTLRPEADADLLLGGARHAADRLRWHDAARGLQGLPPLMVRVARLRQAGASLTIATDASADTGPRLLAMLSLAPLLDLPWLAVDDGPVGMLVTETAGQAYALIPPDSGGEPRLRRLRNDAPLAGLPPSRRQVADRGALDAALSGSGRVALRLFHDVARNVWDNRYIYVAMPTIGFLAGGVIGTPGGPPGMGAGAAAGGSAGLAATATAIAQDAIAGGIKGTVKATVGELRRAWATGSDPESAAWRDWLNRVEASTELGVDTAQSVFGLSQIARRGYRVIVGRPTGLEDVTRAGRAVDERIAGLRRAIGVARARVHNFERLSILEIENALQTLRSTRVALHQALGSRASEQFIARLWSREAADMLADVNDALGPTRDLADVDRLLNVARALSRWWRGDASGPAVAGARQPEAAPTTPSPTVQRPPSDRSEDLPEPLRPVPREWEIRAEQEAARQARERQQAERTAQLAQTDCSVFPGSHPVWDEGKDRPACACPDGSAPNAAGRACIDCAAVEGRFAAAFNAGDLRAAQGWLVEGTRCGWATHAGAAMHDAQRQQAQQEDLQRRQHELDCLRLETDILRALQARDLRAAQSLLGQAGAMGCAVSAPTQSAVREAISRQSQMARDQQTQQALAQFARDWQRLLQGMASGTSAPPSPPAAPRSSTPPPAAAPTARMGQYEPRGVGASCAAAAEVLVQQCNQMNKESQDRKCRLERGASGCALEYAGCSRQLLYDVMGEGSCLLHPSYGPAAQPVAQRYLQEVRVCVEKFFADRQAGAFQRGYACTQAAGQRALQAAEQAGARACEARCAQDGGQRQRAVTNRCECLRPGGRP